MREIHKIAETIAARENCSLYDIEFAGLGGHRVLRVSIDKESADGVSIDDCSHVSRALSEYLEANEGTIPGGAYDLEVSSPGLERVLKEPRHFEKALGKKVSVKSFSPLTQFNEDVPELGLAKQIQGQLLSYDDKGLKISFDEFPKLPEGTEPPAIFVPFDSVTKAHVVFEFKDPSVKPGKAPGKKAKENRG